MSESIINTEELTEASNKEKDEKKVKKKKSKSSSRKSSTVVSAENDESAIQNEQVTEIREDAASDMLPETNGSSDEKEGAKGLSSEETSRGKSTTDRKSLAKSAEEKKAIMLREIDFRTLAELKEAFHLFDINRDGLIDKEDLKFTFTSMGNPDVTEEALEQMLSEMSNGEVDFDAFVKLFGYKSVELDPEEELLAALSKWDYHGNGMISEEILKRDLQSWGDKFSAKEAERALEVAPLYKKDGMTMIDYVKFCHDICGLRNIEKTRQIEKEAEAYEDDLRSFVK